MAGIKCVYFKCGLSKRSDPTIKMYRFPMNDFTRCQKWIIYSGNAALANLSQKSLTNKLICRNISVKILVNLKDCLPAVPFRYKNDEGSESESHRENLDEQIIQLNVSSHSQTYSNSDSIAPIHSKNIDMTDSSISNHEDEDWLKEVQNLPSCSMGIGGRKQSLQEENERLRKELTNARKKVNNLNTQLRATKKKRIMNTQLSANVLYGQGTLTNFTKSLVNMQLRHKMKSPWLLSEKKTALSLFYKVPKTYKYLRQKGLFCQQ
ncbi:uncharacterized protein LOC130440969 [Diorhabda sublineata]|uniref:uncharacterized protein LOC130440969 n=1 Tax=Diorhabda sublineata TaxID=1163346 RepID=UPI0024E076D8|nr:uncharacterized protein LOC130440969 [Diorhabda sublineata]